MSTKKSTLGIKGMHCASCASKIEKSLSKLQGVQTVNVNFASQKAQIVYDEERTDNKLFETVVKKLGYELVGGENGKTVLELIGVESLHCAKIVENTLKDLGVLEVKINLATSKAEINYDSSKLNISHIIRAIKKAGYDARQSTTVDLEKEAREKEIKGWKTKFFLSLIFGIPLLYLSMGHEFSSWLERFGIMLIPEAIREYNMYLQLILSTGIMIISIGFLSEVLRQ